MPLSLRKACHACVKSKRRCIPQLPSCDRCAKKQISCVYDLEPVSQGETLSAGEQDVGGRGGSGLRPRDVNADGEEDAPIKIVYSSVKSAREASMIAIANGYDAASAAASPKMFGSAELTQWVVSFFVDVAREGAAGRGTPFAHHHIVGSKPHDHDYHKEITTTTTTTDSKTQTFNHLLNIHNQLLHLIPLLLSKSTTNNKPNPTLDHLVNTLYTTTHTLWSSPPTHFDPKLYTPWQAWLTAETIRRSMFAAHFIKALYSYLRDGYVPYEPFLESFPFDPRAGLWEAQNEEMWEGVLKRHGGEVGRLKSYNEFVMGRDKSGTGDGRLDPAEDGAFQRLLFLCFHCDAGLRYIRELGELKEPGLW